MSRKTAVVFVLALAIPAAAGIPGADLPAGGVRLGASYEVGELDLDPDGVASAALRTAQAVGTVQIGLLADRFSLSVAGGHGTADLGGWGIDGHTDRFWRVGLAMTVARAGPWTIGVAADVQQWDAADSFPLAGGRFGADLEITQLQLRPGVTWQGPGLMIWCGPSVTWLDGRLLTGWLPLDDRPIRRGIESHGAFGVFGGASCALTESLTLTVEAEASELGHGLALGAEWRI